MKTFTKISEFFATDFYTGYIPYKITGKYTGGGTIGTFIGFLLMFILPNSNLYFNIILFILILIAFFSANIFSKFYNTGDDQRIIIDETVGYLLGLSFLPREINLYILAFVLFRIYDGLKPWPIKVIDKNVKGGFGIVLDDLIAGIFTNITIRIFLY